ncbi:TetR/AcrR family transcriptional regulator [Roseibium algae]|uniref:TetR/AcrR family transcriptional regulator n=1 Tax=Roseibium algae TaxID=3123038 RepID=A0ABU8TLM4_9HYPH
MRQRRKEERPSELLEAAFEEFSQKGFAATRLDDVARRANVTKGTIYVYYPSKEILFTTMVRDLMSPALDDVEALHSLEGGSAEEILKNFLHYIYNTVARDRRKRELMRLLILEAERFPDLTRDHYNQFVEPLLLQLNQYLISLASSGKIRDAPACRSSQILLGPAIALNVWRLLFLDAPEVDTDAHRDAVLDLFLYGLLPR